MTVSDNIDTAVSERGYYTQVSHHLFSLNANVLTLKATAYESEC
jgi:hypothetical protein